ncbi:hypothetical protein L1049_007406 [Liquidambar formosana]|uniref:Glycosyltransferase N-terminal domain-containing protein n=1 Tax=Liquidambar formosana TaxID=63359 RepID=A0AAP0R1R3_LIQFO
MEKQEAAHRTHVLVVPYPAQGHINPMLQFSKRLASKGLKVTLLTTVSITESMQAQATSVKVEPISDKSDQINKSDSIEDYLKRFQIMMSSCLPEFIVKQNTSGHPLSCLVYDSAMPWALDIAKRLGLAGASFFTQSCTVGAIYCNVLQGILTIPVERPSVSIAGLPPLETCDLPSFIYDMGSYPFLLHLVLDQFSNFEKADWIFFNTFDSLEEEVVDSMSKVCPLLTIGPTIPSFYLDNRVENDKAYGLNLFPLEPSASTNWLCTKPIGSVVYVSFGSNANLGEEQMEELAWGLKESNCYFLWVVRASEEAKLPKTFVDETSEKGLVVNWSPQSEVLASDAVGCFLTHCGWNSTLESLSLGVPMVVMPQAGDQTTNAKYVEDVWKVGIRVKVEKNGIWRREEIESCIREVMEGERGIEMKKNARKWKELAKEAVTSEIHILVIPYPVQGHINPMLQFSKCLASKGMEVTLVTTTTISKTVQAQTCPVKIEAISDGFDEGQKIESMDAYVERFKVAASQNLAELIEKQNRSNHPPKVLVYDSGLPWALDIAQRLGLHGAAFFTQSCAVFAIYYHLHQGALKIPIEEDTISIPSMPLLAINDMPSYIYDTSSYPSRLGHVLKRFSNFHKAKWLLFNTFNKLEEEVVNWMASQWPVRTIGPTIPSMFTGKQLEDDDKDYGLDLFKPNVDANCMEWLDTKETSSVVYVSFGSLATLGEEQMEELAWGLKMSNYYFLWVVRESEIKKVPISMVDHKTILEKGLVVTWCPQLCVLAHKAVGCFLTHCGWNSTLEGLSLGVPMVAMPQWTDQITNAKFVEDVWRVGVRVKVDEKGVVKKEEIDLCIREVMEGERGNEIKRNAAMWKVLAQEAIHEGGSSDKNIEEFVENLVCA